MKRNRTTPEMRERYIAKGFGSLEKWGEPWTDEEKKLVLTSDLSDIELSHRLRRTIRTIQAKCVALRRQGCGKV